MVCFQAASLLIRKVLAPMMDALLCMSHTLQSALENGHEDMIMQINFSGAFDKVDGVKLYHVRNSLLIFFRLNLDKLSCQYCRTLNLPNILPLLNFKLVCGSRVTDHRTN